MSNTKNINMQSTSEGYFDVVDLARDLRSEKLFVESELDSIRQLNERLERCAVELAQASWTNTQQRCNLKQVTAQGDFASTTCCPRTDYVLSPVFVDAYKVLRYQDALVLSEVIGRVRLCPGVASAWLVAAECRQAAGTVARALTSGVYAGDCGPVRDVLIHLARHRLATAEDPRRTIGLGSSSFSRLYSELVEGYRPARIFLAAALRAPLLPLLQLDEYLLVDPDKAMDRVKKYCSPGGSSTEYQQKLARYRKWTVSSLVTATRRFIASLTVHWACFPPSIAWVVRQTAIALRESGRVSQEDIHSICTELVFTNFICQAIMNPEAYGITDIPITNIGRFNLVQVAQTLQMLCLIKHQDVDSKLRDLYSRFEKVSVYILLDVLLEQEGYSALPDDCSRDEKSYGEEGGLLLEREDCDSLDELDDTIKTEPAINPNVALFTRSDLQLLVSLLKRLPTNTSNGMEHSPHNQQINPLSLEQDFSNLHIAQPQETSNKKKQKHSANNNGSNGENAGKVNRGYSDNGVSPDEDLNGDTACGVTPDGCETDPVDSGCLDDPFSQDEGLCRILKTIHPDQISRLRALLKRLPDSNFAQEAEKRKSSLKGKSNGTNSGSATSSPAKKKSSTNNSNASTTSDKSKSQEVLVIKLQGDTSYEPIGLVSESKVLEWHYAGVAVHRAGLPVVPLLEGGASVAVEPPHPLQVQGVSDEGVEVVGGAGGSGGVVQGDQHRGQEKRTRFSLSHDEGSIGNTSDNLEAASNHSVTSSLEMETEDQNDNLSDMVSANVSGRGSPNISGRDTPSSQVTEGDNVPQGLAMPQPNRLPSNAPLNPQAASKQAKLVKRTRNDIENKFCKFEIKKLLEGDETISIISDTWSTDVLASDSETIGESSYDRSVVRQHHNILTGSSVVNVGPPMQPDASETASESAWSTDALVSDSDRMTEVDIEECNSLGRSELNRLDSGTPTHHQFSPHNNINRDALLNTRQQMSAVSAHEAHPDNIMLPSTSGLAAVASNSVGNINTSSISKTSKMAGGGSNDNGSDSSSNASGGLGGDMAAVAPSLLSDPEPFPSDIVLRKSLNGPSSSSLYTEMSSSSDSSNEAAGAAALAAFVSDDVIGVVSPSNIIGLNSKSTTGSGPLQSRRPKAYHEHVVPPEALNGIDYEPGDVTVNGFHIGDNGEFPLPLSKPLLTPDSPGAQLSGYPLPLPLPTPHRPMLDDDIMGFQYPNNRTNGGINNQVLESGISTPDGMFHSSSSPFVPPMSSSATSRWLNDPCQKFPSARHEPTSTPSKNNGNKRSTSQEDIAILDNNLGDMKRSNTDSMFRPIRMDSNLSDIDDSGISDLNGCSMMPFLNGADNLSNQDFSSTMSSDISFNNSSNGLNGFPDQFQDSRNDDFGLGIKDNGAESLMRMSSSNVATQHSFSSTNMLTNTISRVLKSTESRTCVINISSSRVDKVTENKADSQSGRTISLNSMLMNSQDSTPTSDKSSTTQEAVSENITERRISPTLGAHVSILSSTEVRMAKGPPSNNVGAATLPRNATPCTSLKPNASTGAIPKSISFDSTAEKSHRHQHRRSNHSGGHTNPNNNGEQEMGPEGGTLNFGDLKNNMKRSGGQILNKIKSFKNRSRGFAASAAGFGKRSGVHQEYSNEEGARNGGDLDSRDIGSLSRGAVEDGQPNKTTHDLTEDILAKYRRKASSSSSEAANSDTGAQQWGAGGGRGHSGATNNRNSQQLLHTNTQHPDDATNVSDGESAMHSDMVLDVECEVFKKKLRKVLSNMDVHSIELSAGNNSAVTLMCALRLAGDSYLPSPECAHAPPLQALRRDARARRPYLAYLARCRRSLIYTIAHIQSEIEWHRSEALRQAGLVVAGRALVSLAGREARLASLQERLRSGLSDEKRDLLAQTLASLNSDMAREEAWTGASAWELEQAALTVERTVMSRVYLQAMFPNGDGDVLRDQLLCEHITRLSACQAGLPPLGVHASLWAPALRSLAQLPAYKAPLDMVRCVQSCLHSIVALLSSLSEAPGADHLTPALVYVIIKVNPQSLLSTIQYVNTFLSSPLEGEQLYCWTQFCSAVEYIKTMDYTRR